LVPGGIFVSTSGGTSGTRWLVRMIGMLVISRFTTQKLKPFIVSLNQPDLLVLTELVEAGKIKPTVERAYPLSEVADALRHVGAGHSQGQTVIRMERD
jgi:NADPH:quinone reductase-like Zn-dependent oxidoreductase